MDFFEGSPQARVRVLMHGLMISGTLNIALIATFIICVLKERPAPISSSICPTLSLKKIKITNRGVLQKFRALSYENLIKKLEDDSPLDEGQRCCDLAIACLATDHYFDVDRALSGYPVDKEVVSLDEGSSLIFYTGLTPGKLEAIRSFAKTEVWPLTPEGLFRKMEQIDELPMSLKEAFESTAEYCAIRSAFQRLPLSISEEVLFSLLKEGDWEDIRSLIDQIEKNCCGKIENFPSFLMSRLEKGSKLAACLLILFEEELALKNLNDDQMKKWGALLKSDPEMGSFLSQIKGEALSHPIQEFPNKGENSLRRYVVKPGDSLWKISRYYAVPIEVIQEMNGLTSDCLKVGTELLLPP